MKNGLSSAVKDFKTLDDGINTLIRENKKMTQKEIVITIMKNICPARTEQIKIEAMYKGVSCADRRMRELANDGLIKNIGKASPDDKTDTWIIVAKNAKISEPEQLELI